MAATLEDLRALVKEATHGLADVTEKKAFGSFGFFVHDTIFALAFRGGLRVVVKLLDEVSQGSLLATEGAEPWAPHGKAMRGWVMVPAAWHDRPDELAKWVRRAYEQVLRSVEQGGGEAAISMLHRGSTTARRMEKKSAKTAAASSPERKRSGRAKKSAPAKRR